MKHKKLFAAFALCLLLAGSLTAAAHGGHHSGRAAVNYAACPVEDCALTHNHLHDGTTYCGRTPCAEEGCTEIGLHSHDGVHYYGCATPPADCGQGRGQGLGRGQGRGCGRRCR